MDFITRGWSSGRRERITKRLALGLAAVWWLTGAASAQAEEFAIRSANTRLVDNVYMLNASIDYRFSRRALDALENGVPLTIRLDIEVERLRSYWLDEEIASLQQRYQLQYHALSGQHVLRNLNSGAANAHPSLESAVSALGMLVDFPLLDENLIDPAGEYEVSLKASLDIEALPSPLRPLAYLTPGWWHGSDWYSWSLTP